MDDGGRVTTGAGDLDLGDRTLALLRSRLPAVAELTVQAIIEQVPPYTDALSGPIGANIRSAVELALGGFLKVAARPSGATAGPRSPVLDGAYALGRGEARAGRSMEALLAAYRIGARESWRQFSRAAVETDLAADTMARFAELVFAYIDELSAASAAGHTDELATTGRVRERYLNLLVRGLLAGESATRLAEAADRAGWRPTTTLAAVVLPTGHASRAVTSLDDRTLRSDELPGLAPDEQSELTLLLVPDADGAGRAGVSRALRGLSASLGPAKPWTLARLSYQRVLRARRLTLPGAGGLIDTEEQLTALVVTADPDALADLRAQVLAPLAGLRSASADRLVETLRAWLLHHGRRDEIARALHVHPQTVRYRVGQLRELFGDRLDDPDTVAALTVALVNPGPG
ncbi:PucR family transcriptional regulator [Nakamurella sp.]|uniref:PucR family transcriptional regulator n=1 Tax=Nakamurella sp. TaxID=1869182 RepID=UPI0037842843